MKALLLWERRKRAKYKKSILNPIMVSVKIISWSLVIVPTGSKNSGHFGQYWIMYCKIRGILVLEWLNYRHIWVLFCVSIYFYIYIYSRGQKILTAPTEVWTWVLQIRSAVHLLQRDRAVGTLIMTPVTDMYI